MGATPREPVPSLSHLLRTVALPSTVPESLTLSSSPSAPLPSADRFATHMVDKALLGGLADDVRSEEPGEEMVNAEDGGRQLAAHIRTLHLITIGTRSVNEGVWSKTPTKCVLVLLLVDISGCSRGFSSAAIRPHRCRRLPPHLPLAPPPSSRPCTRTCNTPSKDASTPPSCSQSHSGRGWGRMHGSGRALVRLRWCC